MSRLRNPLLGRALLVALGLSLLLPLLLATLVYTEAGGRWVLARAAAFTSGRLMLEGVSGRLAGPLTLDRVVWSGEGVVVTARNVSLSWRWWHLLDGVVAVDSVVADGLAITVAGSAEVEGGQPPAALVVPGLPFDVQLGQLAIGALTISSGDAEMLPASRLALSGEWDGHALRVRSLAFDSPLGNVSGDAVVPVAADDALGGTLQVQATLAELPPLVFSLVLGGTAQAPALHVDAPLPWGVTGSLTPVLGPDARWQGQAHVAPLLDAFPFATSVRSLVADVTLAGELMSPAVAMRLAADAGAFGQWQGELAAHVTAQQVRIDTFRLEGAHGMQVAASGDLDLTASPAVRGGVLAWQGVRWPVTGVARLTGAAGELHLEGDREAWSATLRGAASVDAVPAEVRLTAAGDAQGMTVRELVAHLLGGELAGEFDVDWHDALSIAAQLHGRLLNPGALDAAWPGTLAMAVDGRLVVKDGAVSALDVPMLRVNGTLRDMPLDVQGDGAYLAGEWRLAVPRARWGASSATLDATVGDNVSLAIRGDSTDLSAFGIGGRGVVRVTASGERRDPRFNLSADASGLAPEAVNAAELHIAGSGALSAHEVTIGGRLGDERVHTQWRGALKTQDALRYAFTVQSLDIGEAASGWHLDDSSAGWLEKLAWSLPQHCLSRAASRVCLQGSNDAKGLAISATLRQLPLQPLIAWLGVPLRLEGDVDGEVGVRDTPAGGAGLEPAVHLRSSSLLLGARDREAGITPLSLPPVTLDVVSNGNGQWRGTLDQAAGGDARLEGRIDVEPDPGAWNASHIAGDITLTSGQLGVLETLVPALAEPRGSLRANLQVAGTPAQLRLAGEATLMDGSVTFPDVGITLAPLQASLTFQPGEDARPLLRLTASARSGEGDLRLDMEAHGAASRDVVTATGKLSGENFLFAGTESVRVVASPDIEVTVRDGGIDLAGRVTVPSARISVAALPESAVAVSADQHIVGETYSPQARWQIAGGIDVTLGQAVRFSGFGLDAGLAGRLSLRQSGSRTTANGQIRTRDGTYTAYGQNLAINQGSLFWTDTDIDAPTLDVDASRKPAPGVVVGLRAQGPLQRPQLHLYSAPAMAESDQLAYLLFGRPMQSDDSTEQSLMAQAAIGLGLKGGDLLTGRLGSQLGLDQAGIEVPAGGTNDQAALVVGKQLAPGLFVRYGIGLLDAVSTLRLEYTLSDHWRVATESSSERNAADIYFTTERR
ncbi:MAG: translocation/assembly module TamB domain-containing protein [Pseudomonadales bacterium]|nr:translocation/assembly module TamB domain-containing protein [Pseudomonadales bacterium]